jgi:hypothetical protein
MTTQNYPEANLQNTLSLEALEAKSIDYTYQFGENFSKFIEALGITNQIPVQEGFTIKMYKAPTVELADGKVAEGDLIPLSKVTPQVADTKEITLDKFRKVTTIEAIQKYGADEAVDRTDEAILKEVQKGIRDDLFTTIKTNGTTETNLAEGTLQGALATAWASLETLFEDDDITVVAFVNPWDIATQIANKELTLENRFGLKYYTDVTGTVVFSSTRIDRGTIFATAAKNIQVAYISSNSEAYSAFNMVTDEFGYVAMAHDRQLNNVTIETVLLSGILMFPERLDGVVKIDIVPEVDPES